MQILKISMLTSLTSVLMLVAGATISSANTPVVNSGLQVNPETACADGGIARRAGESASDCFERIIRMGTPGGVRSECDLAKENLEKMRTEFSKACSKFNIGGERCERAVAACNEGSDIDWNPSSKEDRDASGASDRFRECPADALRVVGEAKTLLDEAKTEIRELRTKITDARAKVQEARSDIETAEAERTEANNTRDTEYETELEEKNLASEEELKRAQDNKKSLNDRLRQLEQTKIDQDLEYTTELAKIELLCEDQAEKELGEKIASDSRNLSTSSLRQRNQNALLNLRSQGRTHNNTEFRKRAVQRCRQMFDSKWKIPVENLNNTYLARRQRLESEIANTIQQIQEADREIGQTLPAKQRQELERARAKYERDKANIRNRFDQRIGQCGNFNPMAASGRANQTTTPNGCTGLQAKLAQEVAELANLEEEMRDREEDKDYFEEIYSAARSASGNASASEFVNFTGSGADFASAINTFGSACSSDPGFAATIRGLETSYRNLSGQGLPVASNPDPADAAAPNGGATITPAPTTAPRSTVTPPASARPGAN